MDLWDEFEKTLEVSLQMEGDRTLTTGKLIKLIQRAKHTVKANEAQWLNRDWSAACENLVSSEVKEVARESVQS